MLATETTRPAPRGGEGGAAGKGRAAIALIHGVGTNRTIWSRSAPLLAETRPVTTVDLPGFGQSPPPEGGWSLPEVADQVAAALAEQIDPPFELVGSSLGGAVALTLAGRHPQMISRLVLAAPAGFRPAPEILARLAGLIAPPMLSARRLAGLRFADRSSWRRTLLAGTVADGAELAPEAARLMLVASEGAISLRPALEAAARAELSAELGALRMPVGLIWGGLDRVIPAHTAERLLAVRPEMPLELLADSGHIPHLEHPEAFVAALERVRSQLD